MSTFNGLVDEFPDIRIDHFRTQPGRRPPSACFLSHVHSDHLLGLESLRMPFVYCSAVTRNILLRMEKYPHRINFQKGILESRRQTYRHLRLILRALPMETPIELELRPHLAIRVTLFDANHCPGAVMFLIEGDGKAILYTGDVRAEAWWVNSIVRNPVLLPYVSGHRPLDCLYLDTTFASHDDIYKNFPSKSEGLKELLTKIDKCPSQSVFYFHAWTLGYEDVWIALTNYLRCQVHVDDYQLRLYASCVEDGVKHATALVGTQVGNSVHPGCLTNDTTAVIHSCEPGMDCHAQLKNTPNIVWITPIISRSHTGEELAEVGAGGGFGDLHQVSKLEFLADDASLDALRIYCKSLLRDESHMQQMEEILKASTGATSFDIPLDGLGLTQYDKVTLKEFIDLLSKRKSSLTEGSALPSNTGIDHQVIRFPYSRHSSFSELRDFVSHFKPRDIYPCTVDINSWNDDVSMESLFGDLCSTKTFKHDTELRKTVAIHRVDKPPGESTRKRKRREYDSQETASQDSRDVQIDVTSSIKLEAPEEVVEVQQPGKRQNAVIVIDDEDESDHDRLQTTVPEPRSEDPSDISIPDEAFDSQNSHQEDKTNPAAHRNMRMCARQDAYRAARSCLSDDEPSKWDNLHLRSLGWKGHTEEEIIL